MGLKRAEERGAQVRRGKNLRGLMHTHTTLDVRKMKKLPVHKAGNAV